MSNGLRRLAPGVWFIALAVVITACKGNDQPRPAAVWTVTQGAGDDAQRITLSSQARNADTGKAQDPTLSIVCRRGRPNVELRPLAMKCYGYCPEGSALNMSETFSAGDDPTARVASATPKSVPSTPPLSQDLLSNTPDAYTLAGDPHAGENQDGDWRTVSYGGSGVVRFDYGSDQASADYVASVDRQARNFINRIAQWPRFRVGQSGAPSSTFDTRGLAGKLPQFWAACPPPAK